LWDTAGQEDYDRLRPLSYPDTDVAIINFAVCNVESFDNVRNKWDPETKHFLPGIPRILVATKCDLRHDPEVISVLDSLSLKPITTEEVEDTNYKGMAMANEIGAFKYFECSARTGEGIAEVFQYVAKIAMNPNQKKQKRGQCVVL
jgi:Ras homolog gene family, member A